jgi:hypothetical protein
MKKYILAVLMALTIGTAFVTVAFFPGDAIADNDDHPAN